MLTLINTNRMTPPIAPIGMEYVGLAARQAGYEVEILDLCLAKDAAAAMQEYFNTHTPALVGLTFRNVDDCFWPSAQSFLGRLQEDVAAVRTLCQAPIVLGGVGYSIFPQAIVALTGADFGIWGDGEEAVADLLRELRGDQHWDRVPGLVYWEGPNLRANAAAWPTTPTVPVDRDLVDNRAYFQRGGQLGVETKRGCGRPCIYCADPLAKGRASRLRCPAEVAREFRSLLDQGIDVLHICDAEFNLPPAHAMEVCAELIRQGLGERMRWYAYLAVRPFTSDLARQMAKAGCVGINFTSDSADPGMLATYRHIHRREHLHDAVRLCRDHGIAVMLDMLLGGPGESPHTVASTIKAFKRIDPDCAGAALGIRIYPGTTMETIVREEGPLDANANLRRRYAGPVDLLKPTFYLAAALGDEPAQLVRDQIGDDPRFFPPLVESGPTAADDHNYNDNQRLVDALAAGARGAYWDILRRLDHREV
jgi:radical SAM superfamily enzyme YgiQ (UPF0313 family)